MRDLTRGPIARHIVALALPIAIGMIVQTLYFLVDLYFVSRLGGAALAGVGAAGNSMFLILALTQMLSVGTVAAVSHAVGRKDRERANRVFHQSLVLAVGLGAATVAAGIGGLAGRYVGAIGADAATIAAGTTYLDWLLPGMALSFLSTAMGATLQGTGIVKPTMVVQLLTVATNIVLTPILVAGWGTGRPLGVLGAGLSSTLSAGVGLTLMAAYFWRLERYVRFDWRLLAPKLAMLRRMLGIGLPAGGEFALLFVYVAVIYKVVGVFGASAQAGFGVGMRVMQAVFLPALAIAFAVPAIAGQNFGARNGERVRATLRTAATMNVAFMLTLTLLCRWRPEWLVAPFSSDPRTLEVAAGFLTIVSWNFVASGLTFVCSGVFQGLGNTVPSLLASATRLVTFVGPAFWLSARPSYAINHVWYLSVATVAIQAILSIVLLRRELGRKLRFEPEGPVQAPAV